MSALVIALVVVRAPWRWRTGVGLHRRPAVFIDTGLVRFDVRTLIAAAAVGGSISRE